MYEYSKSATEEVQMYVVKSEFSPQDTSSLRKQVLKASAMFNRDCHTVRETTPFGQLQRNPHSRIPIPWISMVTVRIEP